MKLKKLNIFDSIVLLGLALLLATSLFVATRPARDLGSVSTLTIRVDNSVYPVAGQAAKKGTIFLNGVNIEVRIKDAKLESNDLFLVVEGRGKNEGGTQTFNGQQMIVGQKVELHGSFRAKGLVTKVEVE